MRRILSYFYREYQGRARRVTGLVLVAVVLSAVGCAPRRGRGSPPAEPPTDLGAGPGKGRGSDLPLPKGVRPLARAEHPATVLSVAFLPDSERLLTEGDDGSIRVWKARTGEQLSRYILDDGWESSRCAWGGELLAFARLGDVRILEADTGTEVGMVSDMPGEARPAFSSGGKSLAIDNGYGKVAVLDAGTLSRHHEFDLTGVASQGDIGPFVFSSDGALLAVVGCPTVHLCDLATGKIVRALDLGKSVCAVSAVAFSPDDAMLAVGTNGASGRAIQLWEIRTGRKLRSIEAHKEWVGAVAFAPDGGHLVSGEGRRSGEGSVRVWNASTGAEVARLEGHRGPVMTLAFSPDGKLLASGSMDETALVWDWEKTRKTLP